MDLAWWEPRFPLRQDAVVSAGAVFQHRSGTLPLYPGVNSAPRWHLRSQCRLCAADPIVEVTSIQQPHASSAVTVSYDRNFATLN